MENVRAKSQDNTEKRLSDGTEKVKPTNVPHVPKIFHKLMSGSSLCDGIKH